MSTAKSYALGFVTMVLLFGAILAVHFYHVWQHWLAFATGSYNLPGVAHNYNFLSGSGSDISELGILATLALLLAHAVLRNNCHTKGCWRVGSLPVGNPPYKVCRRCHFQATGGYVTMEHLKFHHKLHQRKRLIDAGFKPGDIK
jgi:hypothetical protein